MVGKNNGNNLTRKDALKIARDARKDDFDSVLNGARNALSKPAYDYLESMSDPQHAKPARIPTLMGGLAGRTGVLKTRCEGTTVCGTGNTAFLVVGDPNFMGPYTDRAVLLSTTNAFTGTTAPSVTGTGVVNAYWNNGFAAAQYTTAEGLTFRCTGMIIKIKPISSLAGSTPQSGQMALLQEPNSQSLSGKSFSQIASYSEARVLSGVQANTNKEDETIFIRWRPKGYPVANAAVQAGYWDFNSYTAIATEPNIGSICIAMTATTDVAYAYDIFANWEVRGTYVRDKKSVPPDSRGLDLAIWAMNQHLSSAHVGNPRDLFHSTLAHVYHAVKKHGSFVEKSSMLGKAANLLSRFVPDSVVSALKALVL
jgi:hypothetical protein